MIKEKGIPFVDKKFFKDENGHCYDVDAYDGYGIGKLADDKDTTAPKKIKVLYPKLDKVLADESLSNYVLKYRGLWDLTPADITFGDIMVAFGRIEKPKKRSDNGAKM